MSTLHDILAELTATPKSLERATAATGLPREPGLYAWWTVPRSIPGVPGCPHPTEPDLDLFYVGISPSRATSSGSLRSRVVRNHIGGNTAVRPFRLTLASLLFETNVWQPQMSDRPVLSRDDNLDRAHQAWIDALVEWDQVENVVHRLPETEQWTHFCSGNSGCGRPPSSPPAPKAPDYCPPVMPLGQSEQGICPRAISQTQMGRRPATSPRALDRKRPLSGGLLRAARSANAYSTASVPFMSVACGTQ
jgi:hypothetical protein